MPTLAQKAAYWERELLDLSKRNRMLHYRQTKRSSLVIEDPDFFSLYRQIVHEEKALTFQHPIGRDVDARAYDLLQLLELSGAPVEMLIGDIHTDQRIHDQLLTLRSLRNKAQLAFDEQGTNLLYLAFGFIHWYDGDKKSGDMNSPFLLVPVAFVNGTRPNEYALKLYEDDITINPTLKYALEQKKHFVFPEFDSEKDSFQTYIDQLVPRLNEAGMRFEQKCCLGILSFIKINMYLDLKKNGDRIASNPVLREIYASRNASQQPVFDHDAKPYADSSHVLPSDSSQLDAIALSRAGKSFVLQGPPGTGKSQTITNIIAQALADDKKVLFVSEKMAALQVVYRRLEDVGLADFCLPLHDYKADKKQILDQIAKPLSLKKKVQRPDTGAKLARLEKLKDELNRYSRDIHRVQSSYQMSLYDAMSRLQALEDVPGCGVPFEDAHAFDRLTVLARQDRMTDFGHALEAMSIAPQENPWNGYRADAFLPDDRLRARESIEAWLDAGNDARLLAAQAQEEFQLPVQAIPGDLQHMASLLVAIDQLPPLPLSWLDADMDALSGEIERQRALQRTYRQNKAAAEAFFITCPPMDGVSDWLTRFEQCRTDLQPLGIPIDALADSRDAYASAQTRLNGFIRAWEADDRLFWRAEMPISAAEGLYMLLSRLNAIKVFSPMWLRAEARDNAIQVFRKSYKCQLLIQRTGAALMDFDAASATETEIRDACEAWRRGPLCALSPSILPILARNWELGHPPVFSTMPDFSCFAWCEQVDQLVRSMGLSSSFPFDRIASGLDDCAMARDALAIMETALKPFMPLFTDQECYKGLIRLIEALPGLRAHLPVPFAWLKKENRDAALEVLDQLSALQGSIQAKREPILNEYYPSVFRLEAAEMLSRFEHEYASFFGWLSPQKKKDLRALQLCRKSTVTGITDDEARRVLTILRDIRDLEHGCQVLWAQNGWLLSDDRSAMPDDWQTVRERLAAFDQFCQLKENKTIEGMTRDMLRAVPEAVEATRSISTSALDAALSVWLPGTRKRPIQTLRETMERQMDRLRRLDEMFRTLSVHLKPDATNRHAWSAMKALSQAQDQALTKVAELTEQLSKAQRDYDAMAEARETWLRPAAQGDAFPWEALRHTFDVLSQDDLQHALSAIGDKLPDASLQTLHQLYETIRDYDPDEMWRLILAANKNASPNASASELAAMLDAGLRAIHDATGLMDEFSPHAPENATVTDIAAHMKCLNEVCQANAEAEARQADSMLRFGDMYTGWSTDWNRVAHDLKRWNVCLSRFPEIRENGERYRPVITTTDREDYAIWANAAAHTTQVWMDSYAALEGYFEAGTLSGLTRLEKEERLTHAVDHMEYLDQWLRYVLNRRQIAEAGLDDVAAAFERHNIAPGLYGAAYEKVFLTAWIHQALRNDPALSQFDAAQMERMIGDFRQLSGDYLKINQARLQAALIDRMPRQEAGGEMAILKKELSKKTRLMPLRKLFRQIPYLLMKLKPCLMMSPLSVSYFLDSDFYHFDIVIFDEASQIFPQDAIGAILRGDQAVIAGDTRQMPPTDFFSVDLEQDEDEADEADLGTPLGDSILEEADFTLMSQRLLWHYRSRDERLIAFSNQHFYDGLLYTFPGNEASSSHTGVEFVHVPDGEYSKRRNIKEAETCLRLIREHFQLYPDRSLGVVAFNEAQQGAIEDLVWRERERDPAFAALLDGNRQEPFFIKNLENVQGDERDTIIFSVCFGRAPDGKFRYNFGPLSRAGGERRLNVAVTRARQNIRLVASIRAEDIDLNRAKSDGARLLREYIDYAAHPTALSQMDESAPDDFAGAVARCLEARGFAIERDVGRSAYKVDIAVHSKENPEQYMAAVQCDGRNYASARTACDREEIRRSMLEKLNWWVIDCWSADWFAHPAQARGRLLEQLSQKAPERSAIPAKEIELLPQPTEALIDMPDAIQSLPVYAASSGIRYRATDYPAAYSEYQRRILHCIRYEQPICAELLYKRMAPVWGRKVVNAYVRERVQAQLDALRDEVLQRDGYYVLSDFREAQARTAGDRDIDQIAMDELKADLAFALRQAYGMGRQEAITSAARLMGYQRTGPKIIARLGEALDALCAEGRLTIVHDKVQWREADR